MKNMLKMGMLFLFCLLLSSSALAQDATAEATQETQSPVVVNVSTPAPNTSDTSPTGLIVMGLGVLATVMIAISLSLQIAGNRAKEISNDPNAVALLERGYGSLPDAIKAAVKPLTESLERSDAAIKSLITLANKLTDGIPEASKPTEAQTEQAKTVLRNFNPPYTSTATPPLDIKGPDDLD